MVILRVIMGLNLLALLIAFCVPLCLCMYAQVVLVYHLRGVCAVFDHHQFDPAVHAESVSAHQLPAHLPAYPAVQPLHHHVWFLAHPLLRQGTGKLTCFMLLHTAEMLFI